ncbi:MAG: hypothetical protein KME64_41295 [Scytonematopsis contorta HA4267-MV1]|nr:hypothetical protein [Scytonematopsis contorta HA4267-MV1]
MLAKIYISAIVIFSLNSLTSTVGACKERNCHTWLNEVGAEYQQVFRRNVKQLGL